MEHGEDSLKCFLGVVSTEQGGQDKDLFEAEYDMSYLQGLMQAKGWVKSALAEAVPEFEEFEAKVQKAKDNQEKIEAETKVQWERHEAEEAKKKAKAEKKRKD